MRYQTVVTRLLVGLAIVAGTAVYAEKAGAPLKGVDVKLGKNPGGEVTRTVRTDDRGTAALGVLPRGSYFILLSEPKPSETNVVDVTISSGARKPKTYTYNRKSASIIAYDKSETSRKNETMTFDADGEHAVRVTIVKSKSNITNN